MLHGHQMLGHISPAIKIADNFIGQVTTIVFQHLETHVRHSPLFAASKYHESLATYELHCEQASQMFSYAEV